MTRGTYTAKQLADFNCRCTRCEEAKQREQLEAVKRAIAQFEPKKATRCEEAKQREQLEAVKRAIAQFEPKKAN